MSPAPKKRTKPARQVCQLCTLDDDDIVTWEPEAPGLWRYTCTNHDPAHTWLTTGEGAFDGSGSTGIAEELGVYEDLLALFPEPGPYIEYGIIEHRYAHARPDVYADLVCRYSHTALGLTKYSASAFLGSAVGKLARERHLELKWAPATGYWDYNGKVGAFTLAPAADDAPVVSWVEFAQSEGIDPEDWPALGYVHESPQSLSFRHHLSRSRQGPVQRDIATSGSAPDGRVGEVLARGNLVGLSAR